MSHKSGNGKSIKDKSGGKVCETCLHFVHKSQGVGKCWNWKKMVIDAAQTLPHRKPTDSCDWWEER